MKSDSVFGPGCMRGSVDCQPRRDQRSLTVHGVRSLLLTASSTSLKIGMPISRQVNQLCSVLCGKCLRFSQRDKWQLLAVETNDANLSLKLLHPPGSVEMRFMACECALRPKLATGARRRGGFKPERDGRVRCVIAEERCLFHFCGCG
jgi:hypothetical protein